MLIYYIVKLHAYNKEKTRKKRERKQQLRWLWNIKGLSDASWSLLHPRFATHPKITNKDSSRLTIYQELSD
jgi:hypothetical protein